MPPAPAGAGAGAGAAPASPSSAAAPAAPPAARGYYMTRSLGVVDGVLVLGRVAGEEAAGLVEGSNSAPGGFVVEKAFVG